MNLADEKTVRSLLSGADVTLRRSLGQNFLIDPTVCPRMAAASTDKNCGVIEIGPGIGVLTRELSAAARRVVAIELDRRLDALLSRTLQGCDNVELIFGDALKLDLREIIESRFADCERVAVCANLPYYITSPVIMRLLEERLPLDNITVMVQREAAERLCAPMPSRECGAVTAAVAFYSAAERLFPVGRESFLPPPRVDSEVISLKIRKAPPVAPLDEKKFFAVIKAAFSQRRKTLKNSLSSALGVEKGLISSALDRCALPQTARAEELSLSDFAALSDAMGYE